MARITHYLFGDEAGDLTSKPVFVLGLVKLPVQMRDSVESDLEQICDILGHSGEIKSASTFHKTHAARIEFIRYFADTPELQFRCLVTQPTTFNIQRYTANSLGIPRQDLAYNYLYRQVIQNNCSRNERAIAFLDDKSRSRNDNLFEYLVREIRSVADAQPRDSREVRLLQLADVLAGCVYNELTDGQQKSKRATREYALQALGIRSFWDRGIGDKFNIWHFTPRNAQQSPDSRRK